MLCLKLFKNKVPRKHFEVLTITVVLIRRLQAGVVCCKLNAERTKKWNDFNHPLFWRHIVNQKTVWEKYGAKRGWELFSNKLRNEMIFINQGSYLWGLNNLKITFSHRCLCNFSFFFLRIGEIYNIV